MRQGVASLLLLVLISGCGGGSSRWREIHRTTNPDRLVESAVVFDDIWFTDASRGFVVAHRVSGETFLKQTSDRGQTWTEVAVDAAVRSLVLHPSGRGWLLGSSAVLRTDDGGVTWPTRTDPRAASPLAGGIEAYSFPDDENGWALASMSSGATDHGVLHSTDGGATWALVGATPALDANGSAAAAIHFIDGQTGWFCGGEQGPGRLWRTDDGGKSWTELTTGVSQPLRAVWFTDRDHGVVAGGFSEWDVFKGEYERLDGLLLSTSDGGQTWRKTTDAAPVRSLRFRDAAFGWAWGLDSETLFTTSDGGVRWRPEQLGMTLDGVHMLDSATGWAIATPYDTADSLILRAGSDTAE